MPKFLNSITENGFSVPSSSNNSVANIVYLTKSEFDTLDSQNKLVENTIYMIDDEGVSNIGTPIGGIIFFAGKKEYIPENFVACEGQLLNIETDKVSDEYVKAYGTTYGGDGTSTIGVPDLRDRTLVGLDSTDSDFNVLGKKVGSKYIQEHFHGPGSLHVESSGDHTHRIVGTTNSDGAHVHGLATANGQSNLEWGYQFSYDGHNSAYNHGAFSTDGGVHFHSIDFTSASSGAHTHTLLGHTDADMWNSNNQALTSGTSGNIQPSFVGYYIIRIR